MKLISSKKGQEGKMLIEITNLVLFFLVLIIFIGFAVMLYRAFTSGADQGSLQSADDFARVANGLTEGKSQEALFYLKENMVMVGYPDNSQPTFSCGWNSITHAIGFNAKTVHVPPAGTCGQDKTCVCICQKALTSSICNPALDCKPLNYDDIIVKSAVEGSANYGMAYKGGKFFILFNKCNALPNFVTGSKAITKMNLKRNGQVLEIQITG